MHDYYGSITKQSDSIKQDLLSSFVPEDMGGYEKSYILGIIEDLGILDQEYSVSGWAVFHFNTSCDLLKTRIQRDIAHASQRLALAKVSEWNDTVRKVPLDIVELIAKDIMLRE